MDLKLVEVQTFVSDIEAAHEFYANVLGFKVKQRGTGWIIFDLDGMEFVVQSGATPVGTPTEYGKRCTTMLVLGTSDIRSMVERLRGRGVMFLGEVVEVPQGRFVGFTDPDGNLIELVEQSG
jgi:predicted enzyme related to lactoylglutathione lyase